jgi:MarR-like DNA-binding transcriptional regulator SgrR of sgrS sRNA
VAVAAAPAERVLEASAHGRLLLWSPEVPEPELALRELATLAPENAVFAGAITAAAHEHDPQRRRSALLEAERALRASAVLIPLAVVPVAAHARPNLHGLAADRAGRLVLEDAWLQP